MPDDDSAKGSRVSKNLLTQQKSADSAKYAVSTKFDLSAQIHGDHSAKKYVISAKKLDKSVKPEVCFSCDASQDVCEVRFFLFFVSNVIYDYFHVKISFNTTSKNLLI